MELKSNLNTYAHMAKPDKILVDQITKAQPSFSHMPQIWDNKVSPNLKEYEPMVGSERIHPNREISPHLKINSSKPVLFKNEAIWTNKDACCGGRGLAEHRQDAQTTSNFGGWQSCEQAMLLCCVHPVTITGQMRENGTL